jgi:broad specificity phosphatase PhoE
MIFVVRHGDTGSKCKAVDAPLNEEGRHQAQELIGVLPPFDIIICSPALRALQTAQLISETVVVDDRLLNKKPSDTDYERALRSLLSELPTLGNVVLVTHGRIAKMLYSMIALGRLSREFTDEFPDLGHGKVWYSFEATSSGNFFIGWEPYKPCL